MINAIKAIENGSIDEKYYELIENNWDIKSVIQENLDKFDIGYINFNSKIDSLSGGELSYLKLVKVSMCDKDIIILDEPTNHIDFISVTNLINFINSSNKSFIVVSHNRLLLENMEAIVEIEERDAKLYGGNYTFYEECKLAQINLHEDRVNQIKSRLKKETTHVINQININSRHNSNAKRNREKTGESKLSLDRKKGKSENTLGKLKKTLEGKLNTLNMVKDELLSKKVNYDVTFSSLDKHINNKTIFIMENLIIPYVVHDPVNYIAIGAERIALMGTNGAGKSTLIKCLTQELAYKGYAKIYVPFTYIKQNIYALDMTVIEYISKVVCLEKSAIYTYLANLCITYEMSNMPHKYLSGGEMVKVEILRALLNDIKPELMILDEPTNDIDIKSIVSLERMLNKYNGALLVVSHDSVFLNNINVTAEICLK